jgi:hypothetical protein
MTGIVLLLAWFLFIGELLWADAKPEFRLMAAAVFWPNVLVHSLFNRKCS